ncbi:MAG: DMT family transporter [Saprospiraceae bacterium]|nr:DMT family transporter [Saprospiraceae bacterium]
MSSWIQLVVLGIIWGSSFILIKKALTGLTPVQLASLRIGIACLAFSPFIIINRRKVDWENWHKYLFVGLTTTGIPSFCFAFAQTHVGSGTAGILNSLTPIFTLIISVLFFHARFEWGKLIGVCIGFLGAGLLVYNSGADSGSSNIWYTLLIFLATLCYGFNANAVKNFFPSTSSVMVSAVAFMLVGFPALVYLVVSGDLFSLVTNPVVYPALMWGDFSPSCARLWPM